MISNCGHDERGKYAGGQPGDQTGGEWCIRTWYNRPWNCVLRHSDQRVREDLARVARAAANNNLVGYCQSHRGTYYAHLKASNWDPAKITIACEADCSSGVAANVIAVGHRLGVAGLQRVNQNLTTYNMRSALKSAGFQVLTASGYLTSDAYLLPGDILLNDNAHVATNLDKGKYVADMVQEGSGTGGSDYMFSVGLIKKGSVGNDVLLFQKCAKATGDYTGNLDREYGPLCEEACRRIQRRNQPGAGTVDGECGANTGPYVVEV